MKKYWVVLKMSFGREMQYRTNLLFGRLRNFILLLLIFLVFSKLTETTGSFAGYAQAEIFTYLMGINILRGIIFGGQSRQMASDINQGIFSKYLAMPVNHFFFQFFSEAGQRLMNLIFAIIEVGFFAIIFKVNFVWQDNILQFEYFIIAVGLALVIYYLLSYIVNMLAFWSREAMGPRFLFEWLLEFASGVYFPLDILAYSIFSALSCLPFFYIIFFPISVYLGRIKSTDILYGLAYQLFFILLFSYFTNVVWKKGLKRYSGEGM